MKKISSIILLVWCCIACKPDVASEVWSELGVEFAEQEVSMTLDKVTPLEFTVSGVCGAVIVVDVAFQDSDWKAEGNVNSETGAGLLYVSAPDKISTTLATVTVRDSANGREAESYISVSSTPAGLDPISLVYSQDSCALAVGDTVSVGFHISGIGTAEIEDPLEENITVTAGVEVVQVTYDPSGATGTIRLAAPETSQGGTVSVTMTVKDSFNRSARAELKISVMSAPVEDVPEVPVTPGSTIVPSDKSYNCYLVRPGGYARFTKKLPGIVRLELAWQDAPGIIYSMSVSSEDGYVTVLTNEVAGNALVLGKDADGKTLWSWHIWVTDFDPEATAVTVDGITFMDRNLGAVNASEGDIGAVGHTYQWGRKDPMPRAISYAKSYADCVIYDIYGNSITPHNGTNGSGGMYYMFRPEAETSEVVTMADATAAPEYFFCRNDYNVAWWNGIEPEDAKDFWGGVSGVKSEYDPCPEGWKVPVVSGDKHPYQFVTTDAAVVDADMKGLRYTAANNKTLWFPYTGERTRSEGLIARTARGGNYWTGTFDQLYAKTTSAGEKQQHELYKYMQFKANGGKYLSGYSRQAYVATGLAVRCVKE